MYENKSKAIRAHASNARGRNHFVREQQGTMECGVINEQGHLVSSSRN